MKEPNVFVSAAVPYGLRQQVVALADRDGVPLSEEIRRGLLVLVESQQAERHDEPVVVA